MLSSPEYSNLIELLQARAAENRDYVGYHFLADGENESASLSWGELDDRARAIGAQLQQMTEPGDRAMMLYPSGLEVLIAFMGCLYAGVVPVPAFPLQPNRPPTAFAAMLKDAQTDVIMTTSPSLAGTQLLLATIPDVLDARPLRWLATDTLDPALAETWQMPRITPELPILLFYTSGSTSQPRGVVRTHREILEGISSSLSYVADILKSMVVWAPLYHASGLLGAGLTPLLLRSQLILLPPLAVMEKPIRWLISISNYHGTSSGGPNFIYQYCVDRTTPAEREGLDLSSWLNASCGGEPIRMSTLDQFARTYEPYGFRREGFTTGYGLTESGLQATFSLGITARGFDRTALRENQVIACETTDPGAVVLVSCGYPVPTMTVRIVDPVTCLECPPDRVGEIWLSGITLADGYWNNPEETERTFRARLADTGEGPYLRTGDLGFFYEGELYIAGRLKETIIVHGRNYYAQDIEGAVAASHPAIQPAASAAFSVPVGAEERIVIFQELRPDAQNVDPEAISQAMRRAAAETLELSLYGVVLVKPGSLPRTGMGKIQRYLVRRQYLEAQSSDQLV